MDTVGSTASILTIINAILSSCKAIDTVVHLPKAFEQTQNSLPIVQKTLKGAARRLENATLTENERKWFADLVSKAQKLQQIVDVLKAKCQEDEEAKTWDILSSVYYEIIRGCQAHKVENLLNNILEDLKKLVMNEVFNQATQEDLEEIKQAIDELKEAGPSLDDSAFERRNVNYHGQTIAEGGFGQQVYPSGGSQSFFQGGFNFTGREQKISFGVDRMKGTEKSFFHKLFVPNQINPRNEKKRIERQKGDLLKRLYQWIFSHSDFQRWYRDHSSHLLWVRGDPGKGKTMLLCGIIDELEAISRDETARPCNIIYFFCQATDSRTNNAIAVLRGLLMLLFIQQPDLRNTYELSSEHLPLDVNSWDALYDLFIKLLHEPSLHDTYLIVDALDECSDGLDELLRLVSHSSMSPAKVLVSSRNWPPIEDGLSKVSAKVSLKLELNGEAISAAVDAYIDYKVESLVVSKDYDDMTRESVLHHLKSNANNTFLWVALVCQELQKLEVRKWHIRQKLRSLPPTLDALYAQMMGQILHSEDASICRQVLALLSLVYRPLSLGELIFYIRSPEELPSDVNSLHEIVELCGSFLTVKENGIIYFVHQSAKDFLLDKMSDTVLPEGLGEAHRIIAKRSLNIMSTTLEENIYYLPFAGFTVNEVEPPIPDPLLPARYACIHWVDHVTESCWQQTEGTSYTLEDDSPVHNFLRNSLLHWLEALSLLGSISTAIVSMEKLASRPQTSSTLRANTERRLSQYSELKTLVDEIWRFTRYYKPALEESPLQVYSSALVFSPACSLIRRLFQRDDEPYWMLQKPIMADGWSAELQTVDCRRRESVSIAVSPDGTLIAAACFDETIRLWDLSTCDCKMTIQGHFGMVNSVVFSPDGRLLASASDDATVKLWAADRGWCKMTLDGHYDAVTAAIFLPNLELLASASSDKTIKLWDFHTGVCKRTIEAHGDTINSLVCSPDGERLVSASDDTTIKLWVTATGQCRRVLKGHDDQVTSVGFSPNGKIVASASHDETVRLWDLHKGYCEKTLKGHSDVVGSVVFSPDGKLLASASEDATVKLWATDTGYCEKTLDGHRDAVRSVAFLRDGKQVISTSDDSTIKLWDITVDKRDETLERHRDWITSIIFSPDGRHVASASDDGTVKLWDVASGNFEKTLDGHGDPVNSIAFAPDGKRVASASEDRTVKVWNVMTGTCEKTLKGHETSVSLVFFSPDGKALASSSSDNTVMVWNAATGWCERIFKTSEKFYTLGFSYGREQFHASKELFGSKQTTTTALQQLRRPSVLGFSDDGAWIIKDEKRLLWVPPEYRAKEWEVMEHTMAIACSSGRVIILGFSEDA